MKWKLFLGLSKKMWVVWEKGFKISVQKAAEKEQVDSLFFSFGFFDVDFIKNEEQDRRRERVAEN